MDNSPFHVITGAFGFSGKYIARRLLADGLRVKTLTNSPNRANPFDNAIEVMPFNFGDPGKLIKSLEGADVLYNTYWVRFNHKDFVHSEAITNTKILFDSAIKAGVKRIVHVSITNPSETSDLEYFRGKALLEKALIESGIPHAILRPAVLFGKEDILINNIAWTLRNLPVFGLFGDGEYGIQPIFVDDMAALAIKHGKAGENVIINAIGPESFTFKELVSEIGRIIEKERPTIPVPARLGYWTAGIIGRLMGDVFLTWDEVKALMDNLLIVDTKPTGTTKLTSWAKDHANDLGINYANEIGRRKDRLSEYI